MLSTIWEDIDNEAEAIVLTDTKYQPTSLSNKLYEIINDKEARHKVLKGNKIRGLYADLSAIQEHEKVVMKDETLSMLVESLFKKEDVASITALDRIFLNSYCRRLLRAKLEKDFNGKELVKGQVVTEYTNGETDAAIVETMQLLRVICRYLGIGSTIEPGSFTQDKLYMPSFWFSISSKFVNLFGETRIQVIEKDEEFPLTSAEAMSLSSGQQQIRESQVFMLLNIVFNTWSGSTLVIEKDIVKVVPATYVNRMLPKLVDLSYK